MTRWQWLRFGAPCWWRQSPFYVMSPKDVWKFNCPVVFWTPFPTTSLCFTLLGKAERSGGAKGWGLRRGWMRMRRWTLNVILLLWKVSGESCVCVYARAPSLSSCAMKLPVPSHRCFSLKDNLMNEDSLAGFGISCDLFLPLRWRASFQKFSSSSCLLRRKEEKGEKNIFLQFAELFVSVFWKSWKIGEAQNLKDLWRVNVSGRHWQKVFLLVAVFAHRRKECYLLNVCITGKIKGHKHVLIKRTFTVSCLLDCFWATFCLLRSHFHSVSEALPFEICSTQQSILVCIWVQRQTLHFHLSVPGLLWMSDNLQCNPAQQFVLFAIVSRLRLSLVCGQSADCNPNWGTVLRWFCPLAPTPGCWSSESESSKNAVLSEHCAIFGPCDIRTRAQFSPKRISAIFTFSRHLTKKNNSCPFWAFVDTADVLSLIFLFLGNPSENWSKPSMAMSCLTTWSEAADVAFAAMKKALQSPPTLGIPDTTKPFVEAVDERQGCMTSVFLQKHSFDLGPVDYFSAKLDPVAAGLPQCLRATAAAEKALPASCPVESAGTTRRFPHFSWANLSAVREWCTRCLQACQRLNSPLPEARWLRLGEGPLGEEQEGQPLAKSFSSSPGVPDRRQGCWEGHLDPCEPLQASRRWGPDGPDAPGEREKRLAKSPPDVDVRHQTSQDWMVNRNTPLQCKQQGGTSWNCYVYS